MEVKIRKATQADFETILSIWLEGLKFLYPNKTITNEEKEAFKSNFETASEPFGYWVAESDGLVVGWCSVIESFLHPIRKNEQGELTAFISKKFHSSGVYQKIAKVFFKELENTSIKAIWAFVDIGNKKSQKAAELSGMKICGQTSTKTLLIKEY